MDTVYIKNLVTSTINVFGGSSGDIPIYNGTSFDVLNAGAAGQVLTSTGPTTPPVFLTPGASVIPDPLTLNRVNLNILGPNATTNISVLGNLKLQSGNTNTYYAEGAATSTGTSNTIVGYNSGPSITTGSQNTAVGRDSLTGANFSNATAVGYQSLFNSTQNGTAVGYQCGLGNSFAGFVGLGSIVGTNNTGQNFLIGNNLTTSGGVNILIGENITSSVSNSVVVGHGSGINVTNKTIAVGNNSLAANAAADNIAVGNNAITLCTGTANVVVGNDALTANNAASNVVAIGSASAGSNFGSSVVAIGTSALNANQATGTIGIGYQSLIVNTTGLNTAVGYQTLAANVSGTRNTAVGYQTLNTNVGGSDSVAVGSSALSLCAPAIQSVAVGSSAAAASSSLTDVVAIGYNAAQVGTTGSFVAIGARAGLAATPGTIAIGVDTLGITTHGGIFIGNQAGQTIGGGGSVGIGTNAGKSSSTNSVHIGENAGASDTNAFEVSLGANALQNGTTGSGPNVVIGYNAVASSGLYQHSVAVGPQTLSSFTKAVESVVIGFAAGTSANASNAVIIGSDAGNNAFDDDTYIGRLCAFASVSTGGNVVIGSSAAGTGAQTLSNTVIIGKEAAANVSVAGSADDVIIGYRAVQSVVGGSPKIAIGSGALLAGSGADVISIGKDSCNNLTTAATSIVAIGSDVLQTNFNHTNNVIVGNSAASALSAASVGNVVIGDNSFNTAKSINGSVVIGRNCLNSISGPSTFNNFVAIGSNISGTTADNFVAIGESCRAGPSGVSIGESAGAGTNTVAIGYRALAAGTTATSQCVVGYQAMTNYTDAVGVGNTAFGNDTFGNLNSGSNNTAVGYMANNAGPTTLNSTTSIGSQTRADQTEAIAIGYLAFASVQNSVQIGQATVGSGAGIFTYRTQQISAQSWIGGGVTTASIDNSGNIIRTPSDERIKKEIKEVRGDDVLDKFNELQPRKYRYRDEKKYGDLEEYGLIAQEVEKIFPDLVFESDGVKGIRYQQFIPMIIAVLQKITKKD